MLKIKKYINELMKSNCYILWDDESHRCVVIDPASEKSLKEINFIDEHDLSLDYILLTHEHTDHNWGVNSLFKAYPEAKIVCHEICAKKIEEESSKYFRLYFDDTSYTYVVDRIDITFGNERYNLLWNDINILFEYVPGHSLGSVCIIVDKMMFTGDTIMLYKPYINKHDGSKELYKLSIEYLNDKYSGKNMTIYPGHGDSYIFI